jgi:hypothetical protein
VNPLRIVLTKLWAPVPWMLEAAIILEVVLGKYVEGGIIAGLLVFNAALVFFQEGRAQATLTALKSRPALNAAVRRDDAWNTIPYPDAGNSAANSRMNMFTAFIISQAVSSLTRPRGTVRSDST